jgi:hypothetical protein
MAGERVGVAGVGAASVASILTYRFLFLFVAFGLASLGCSSLRFCSIFLPRAAGNYKRI